MGKASWTEWFLGLGVAGALAYAGYVNRTELAEFATSQHKPAAVIVKERPQPPKVEVWGPNVPKAEPPKDPETWYTRIGYFTEPSELPGDKIKLVLEKAEDDLDNLEENSANGISQKLAKLPFEEVMEGSISQSKVFFDAHETFQTELSDIVEVAPFKNEAATENFRNVRTGVQDAIDMLNHESFDPSALDQLRRKKDRRQALDTIAKLKQEFVIESLDDAVEGNWDSQDRENFTQYLIASVDGLFRGMDFQKAPYVNPKDPSDRAVVWHPRKLSPNFPSAFLHPDAKDRFDQFVDRSIDHLERYAQLRPDAPEAFIENRRKLLKSLDGISDEEWTKFVSALSIVQNVPQNIPKYIEANLQGHDLEAVLTNGPINRLEKQVQDAAEYLRDLASSPSPLNRYNPAKIKFKDLQEEDKERQAYFNLMGLDLQSYDLPQLWNQVIDRVTDHPPKTEEEWERVKENLAKQGHVIGPVYSKHIWELVQKLNGKGGNRDLIRRRLRLLPRLNYSAAGEAIVRIANGVPEKNDRKVVMSTIADIPRQAYPIIDAAKDKTLLDAYLSPIAVYRGVMAHARAKGKVDQVVPTIGHHGEKAIPDDYLQSHDGSNFDEYIPRLEHRIHVYPRQRTTSSRIKKDGEWVELWSAIGQAYKKENMLIQTVDPESENNRMRTLIRELKGNAKLRGLIRSRKFKKLIKEYYDSGEELESLEKRIAQATAKGKKSRVLAHELSVQEKESEKLAYKIKEQFEQVGVGLDFTNHVLTFPEGAITYGTMPNGEARALFKSDPEEFVDEERDIYRRALLNDILIGSHLDPGLVQLTNDHMARGFWPTEEDVDNYLSRNLRLERLTSDIFDRAPHLEGFTEDGSIVGVDGECNNVLEGLMFASDLYDQSTASFNHHKPKRALKKAAWFLSKAFIRPDQAYASGLIQLLQGGIREDGLWSIAAGYFGNNVPSRANLYDATAYTTIAYTVVKNKDRPMGGLFRTTSDLTLGKVERLGKRAKGLVTAPIKLIENDHNAPVMVNSLLGAAAFNDITVLERTYELMRANFENYQSGRAPFIRLLYP